MADPNTVNNPFITLKKLGGDGTEQFKARLNTTPPSVSEDTYRSDMKKPEHSLESDNRATKMRMDEGVDSFKQYSITLMDIDNVLYEYFISVIQPRVSGPGGEAIEVPVRHASPERWAAIQRDGVLRDKQGQLQRPMIIFTRSNMERDDQLVTFNKYLTVPFVKKFDKYNMYDRFSALSGTKPAGEIHNVTFPDHVVLTYDFTMSTEYVQQMNTLVEKINFASDDYWGDPQRLKFRASVQGFSNTIEVPSDDDRVVTTTFNLTVNAYLLPEIFNNQTTTQRGLTKRKVVFSSEAIAGPGGVQGEDEIPSRNIFTLTRTNRELFLENTDIEYEIHTWNDEAYYNLILLGQDYQISFKKDVTGDYLVWGVDNSESKVYCGETLTVDISTIWNAEVSVDTNSSEILKIKFIRKNNS
jgi:hypothetical protein